MRSSGPKRWAGGHKGEKVTPQILVHFHYWQLCDRGRGHLFGNGRAKISFGGGKNLVRRGADITFGRKQKSHLVGSISLVWRGQNQQGADNTFVARSENIVWRGA